MMNNEAPYDKEKKKGKLRYDITGRYVISAQYGDDKDQPWYSITRLIKPFLVALVIVFMFPVLLALFLEESPFFDAQQVAETCQQLTLLPASNFCSNPDKQTAATFEEALEQTYPHRSTTLSQLQDQWGRDLYCEQKTRCKLSLPIQYVYLYVDYNEHDQVLSYYVSDQRGAQ